MAVRFDAAADRLLRTSSLLNYGAAYTWMCWAYISTDTNAAVNIAQLIDAAGETGQDGFGLDSTGTTLVVIVASDSYGTFNITSGTNLTAATWYHVTMVRVSTTSLLVYLNGALNISDTSNISAGAGRSAPDRMEMGASLTSNEYPFNGRVAWIKSWSVALSSTEVAAEMYAGAPMRTANLHGWWPCLPGATERLADYSGNGYTWTAGGTLTDEEGPLNVGMLVAKRRLQVPGMRQWQPRWAG